jgi:lysophospholipase L1-like esterase
VLFISYNDLFQLEPELFENRLQTWIGTMAGRPNQLVVLPPAVRSQRVWTIYGISKADALRRERARWARVTALARRRGVALLRFATADATYLQADRLHPNQKGQHELATQIAKRLPICSE